MNSPKEIKNRIDKFFDMTVEKFLKTLPNGIYFTSELLEGLEKFMEEKRTPAIIYPTKMYLGLSLKRLGVVKTLFKRKRAYFIKYVNKIT